MSCSTRRCLPIQKPLFQRKLAQLRNPSHSSEVALLLLDKDPVLYDENPYEASSVSGIKISSFILKEGSFRG